MRVRQIIGWIVGPTIWVANLSLMAYGLWTQAWYGNVLAGIFLVFGIGVWVMMRYVDRQVRAEFERTMKEGELDE